MYALFTELARRVRRFELGDTERALHNILRGFTRLDVTVGLAHSAQPDRSVDNEYGRGSDTGPLGNRRFNFATGCGAGCREFLDFMKFLGFMKLTDARGPAPFVRVAAWVRGPFYTSLNHHRQGVTMTQPSQHQPDAAEQQAREQVVTDEVVEIVRAHV